jgi:mannan endo-1,4-beta-mannosidase
LVVLLLLSSLYGNTSFGAPVDEFVRVDQTSFRAGGRPFAFVGANVAVTHGSYFRSHTEQTLEAARSDGLTVVRVWALGEGAPDAPGWSRDSELFRTGPSGFQETAYVQLDRVLAAARARGLRVILTLANHWADYGGAPMYLQWAGLPTTGFGARDRFFSDVRVRAWYRAHLEHLLERTNTITGVRYSDDPTLFAWELINESQVESEEGARARRDWIEEMASVIRARDRQHLITPGVTGYGTRRERAEWLAICRLPAVDYCDSHLYPQTSDEVPSLADLQAFIDDRVQLARFVAGKPLVFGEFSFDTRRARDGWLGRGRADWFRDFLTRVFDDGAAGALAWIYQPWAGKERDFGIYVDRQETDDIRDVLRQAAERARLGPPARNSPRLGPAVGERPLYNPYRTVSHLAPALFREEQARTVVTLRPENFSIGHFERVGAWAGGTVAHAYGSGDGWFEWRFPAPARIARRMTLIARISSEFPGESAPPDGGSRVTVSIDGRSLAELDAIPDDGRGSVRQVVLTDPAVLRKLAGRAHVLRLEVPPGPHANGLCVYGEATGRGPAPSDLTPIELRFEH